jgi:hypothetical protein
MLPASLILISWPPFTEQWATTYLQVLFESFLFAFGVPTAIFSLIVDNDIKRVAQTRLKARRYFLATGMLYVAVLIIVWFIHPDQQAGPSQNDAQGLGSVLKSVFAASTITILPSIVLFMGWRLNRQFKREKVVERLANELFDKFEEDGNLDSVALKDLSYLGEHGKAGDEKGLVLDVIDQLTRRVQKRVKEKNLQYRGFELEALIRHIPAMLDNNIEPGDDRNYRRAVELLANIWRWLSKRRHITDDALSAREVLRHLALLSVDSTGEETALAYLEVAADCDSHIVFDIGLAAFKSNKYLLAVAALSKLEEMAGNAVVKNNGMESSRETLSNLLGMTAHFATSGPSGFRRAETSLQLNEELFDPSLRSAFTEAFEYQYQMGRYGTADMITLLASEVGKMKTVDLDRPIAAAAPTTAAPKVNGP